MLGLFGIGAVVVLSMMAQRYGKVLQRVERSQAAAPARVAGGGSAAAQKRALRSVDAFIAVRRAFAEGPMSDRLLAYPEPGWPLGEEEVRARDLALSNAGLDRETYLGILNSYEAWKAGREDLSGPLPAAFAQRREELLALE